MTPLARRPCTHGCEGEHRFTTLLFDFDGTIVDTETTDLRAWQREFERHGLTLDVPWWLSHLGKHGDSSICLGELERLLGGPIDRELVSQRQRDHEMELSAAEPPRAGILDILDSAQEQGFHLGVVSSSSEKWVVDSLKRLDLLPRFSVVVTGSDVENRKPAPDGYLRALQALGSSPDQTIAFEDSLTGATAAHCADIACVFSPVFEVSAFPLSGNEFVVERLKDCSLAELTRRIATSFSCSADMSPDIPDSIQHVRFQQIVDTEH